MSNTTSWVIKNRTTGEVILETFDKKKVDALNTDKYEAVPIIEHLASLSVKVVSEPSEPKPEMPEVKNTILLYEQDGGVMQCCCTEVFAKAKLDDAVSKEQGASMFSTSDGWDADLFYSVSPDFRDRVESAKTRMRRQIKIRNALDNNGVPKDMSIRRSVYKAFQELQEGNFPIF